MITSLKNNAIDPSTSLGSLNCSSDSCQALCLYVLKLLVRISKLFKGQEEAYRPSQKVIFHPTQGEGAEGKSKEKDILIEGGHLGIGKKPGARETLRMTPAKTLSDSGEGE